MAPSENATSTHPTCSLRKTRGRQVGPAECEEVMRAWEIYSGCGHPARKDKVAKSDAGASVG
jgi:hypothetical protein